jgi:hypothetical protein
MLKGFRRDCGRRNIAPERADLLLFDQLIASWAARNEILKNSSARILIIVV